MSVSASDYDYSLPDALIARHPAPRREDARMMVLHRDSGRIEHRGFRDFADTLRPDDLTVLNDTKVIPARAFSEDGRIELLFLDPMGGTSWKCLVKPGRKMRVGKTVRLTGCEGVVREILPEGERVIEFDALPDLDAIGRIPLPPYLHRDAEPEDVERYQTVYAREAGAVAAPTAGLHFTDAILDAIPHAFVTLHVGAGTFKPVQTEFLEEHRMHSERFSVSADAAARIAAAKSVMAIGTTTVRVLESVARESGEIVAGEGSTDIFIHPPYEFRVVDRLLTNFHLPRSTLLMLISAFAGREFVLEAYAEAVRERYRFYSYGDCMLIL
jgi:S-adenosylmethionine:tRNA ribosyltransferase-isomerase